MGYIHTYSPEERERLMRQIRYLSPLIMDPIDFSKAKRVLDYGCGVGAQTGALVQRYPHLKLTAVDRNPDQIAAGEQTFAKWNDRIQWIHAGLTVIFGWCRR